MPTQLQKVLGAGCLILGLVVFDYSSAWPYAIATVIFLCVGAYLLTQALFAIFVTVLCISCIRYFSGYESLYGYVALLSGMACLYVVWQRFRERIAATHEERWQQRENKDQE